MLKEGLWHALGPDININISKGKEAHNASCMSPNAGSCLALPSGAGLGLAYRTMEASTCLNLFKEIALPLKNH